MEVDGWVQVSLRIFFGKSSQNRSETVLIFWSSMPFVFCLYIQCTLLKVVSYYYDLSVLSIYVSDGVSKKFGWDGRVGCLFWILEFVLTCKAPKYGTIFLGRIIDDALPSGPSSTGSHGVAS